MQGSSYVFPQGGLTIVLILRESHAVIHTWPETGTVNIDIFSCTTRLRSMEAVDELSALLGAGNISVRTLLQRGAEKGEADDAMLGAELRHIRVLGVDRIAHFEMICERTDRLQNVTRQCAESGVRRPRHPS